ncbi:MAG TPA: winged helix-turn-helix domain-containing protein [Solirubrobacterales bacterium]
MSNIPTPDGGVGDRVLRIISHPVRIEALRMLQNRTASPKELAEELGESVSNVSYHFNYLHLEDCIEMVGTEPRRGAVEHYYRAKLTPMHDEESWSALPEALRTEISAVELRGLFGEAIQALNAGSFDAREDRRLSWTSMELDEEGWRELSDRQAEWGAELERIKAKAARRLALDGATRRRVVAAVLGFEAPSSADLVDAAKRP